MTKRFLITRPKHDVNTSYLYDFSKNIVETIKATPDIKITVLEGFEANRNETEKALTKLNPGLVFLNGHGNKKSVMGHRDEIILDEKNVILTKDKIVYALSCDSLEELGPIAIKKGTRAYIGYRASFMIIYDPTRSGSPHKDKNALPFKRACSTLIDALVFGNTVEKAIELTKREYIHLIRSYGTSEDDPYGDVPLIRFALAWDHEFLDAEGDLNTTL